MSNEEIDTGVYNDCNYVYGLLLCVGDYIEVYPRTRSLAVFRGKLKKIGISSIILENEENDIAIRLSEIKAIRKIKLKSK